MRPFPILLLLALWGNVSPGLSNPDSYNLPALDNQQSGVLAKRSGNIGDTAITSEHGVPAQKHRRDSAAHNGKLHTTDFPYSQTSTTGHERALLRHDGHAKRSLTAELGPIGRPRLAPRALPRPSLAGLQRLYQSRPDFLHKRPRHFSYNPRYWGQKVHFYEDEELHNFQKASAGKPEGTRRAPAGRGHGLTKRSADGRAPVAGLVAAGTAGR